MPTEIAAIESWHAHVYFDPATRDAAATLREWVAARFDTQLGRWHDIPVGPHPKAMYQIAFANDQFPTLVPFLGLNRMGLTILVHPETNRERDDHLQHALWMGEDLPLDGSKLRETKI
jgi:DOPA 4,5-dioxygenase